MATTDPRRTLGAAGERLARAHLEARGMTVLDANFRTREGEIDLVASDERTLVFCEVKTRVADAGRPADLGPFAAIGARKQRRLRLLARQWLAQHERERSDRATAGGGAEIRFDAIGIELDGNGRLLRLDHLEGAF